VVMGIVRGTTIPFERGFLPGRLLNGRDGGSGLW
jgi:hypothetical protein